MKIIVTILLTLLTTSATFAGPFVIGGVARDYYRSICGQIYKRNICQSLSGCPMYYLVADKASQTRAANPYKHNHNPYLISFAQESLINQAQAASSSGESVCVRGAVGPENDPDRIHAYQIINNSEAP